MNSNNSNINNSIDQWADFWYYDIGVNIIPANIREKNTFIPWTFWQDSGYRR